MPRVSILLTTYNRPDMLKIAVESVLSQTYKEWELIVLDDNSDDLRQVNYLKKIENYENVYVYRSDVKKEDRGKTTRYATLINYALENMDINEFVTYLCDDDFYYQDRLKLMVEKLDSDPNIQVVCGKQKCFQQMPDGHLEDSPIGCRNVDDVITRAACVIDHSSVMMRKSLIDNVGLWEESPAYWGAGDAVYWDKINNTGVPFHGIKEVLDAHVYHDGSWTKDQRWLTL